MPTAAYIEKVFNAEHLAIIYQARAILDEYDRQGYDLSLRQLYYQYISRDLLPNTDQSYKRLGGIISDARLAGYLDWDMIRDRGRVQVANPHWDDPADFLTSVAPQFRIDTWQEQPVYIEVMVEKQALEGVLIPACRSVDVAFIANKGYSSSSAMYEAGRRMRAAILAGKAVHVLYLGDHDPSGIDMSRDVEDRLTMFACDPDAYRTAVEDWGGDVPDIQAIYDDYDIGGEWAQSKEDNPDFEPSLTVHRLALNYDQVQTYNPPPNPAKLTDSRAEGYIAKYGRTSWELDALDPATLASLVTDAVYDLADIDKLTETEKRQAAGRDALVKFAREYKP